MFVVEERGSHQSQAQLGSLTLSQSADRAVRDAGRTVTTAWRAAFDQMVQAFPLKH
jgi:hypothetical protein